MNNYDLVLISDTKQIIVSSSSNIKDLLEKISSYRHANMIAGGHDPISDNLWINNGNKKFQVNNQVIEDFELKLTEEEDWEYININ